jgi:trk system potassium uptake protein TrkH
MVIIVSMSGGVSLILYGRAYREGWKTLALDRQLQGFIGAGIAATALTAFFLWYQDGFHWKSALQHGMLNALSAQSTAGFASTDISQVGDGAKVTLIFAMAAGGSIGSTAGGIKIFRLLIVFRLLLLVLQRAGAPPNAILEARISGRRLEADEIQGVLCIIVAFIGFAAISWFFFIALGYEPLDSLFEVVSALGTAGMTTGITSPGLNPLLKGVLCFDMLLGRLEIMAWLVVFYPGTWWGRRRQYS